MFYDSMTGLLLDWEAWPARACAFFHVLFYGSPTKYMGNCQNHGLFGEPYILLFLIRHPQVWKPQIDPDNHLCVLNGSWLDRLGRYTARRFL